MNTTPSTLPQTRREARPVRLRFQLLIFAAARTAINTGYRMVYPFLPAIARGLGVEFEAVVLAITARSSLGVFGPLFGSVSDALGRRVGMMLGLTLFVGSMLLVTLWPTYAALFAALLLAGVGKIVFETGMHAYVSDRIAYARRGLAMAITEFGWSGAFLLGMPVVGWLIARGGWTAPFPLLAGLVLAFAVVVWRMLPADPPAAEKRPLPHQGLRMVLAHAPAVAGLLVSVLISSSNELVSIIYGAWMEDAFGLQVAALGLASTVIGVAELGGEGLTAWLSDRLGKRRAVGSGLAVYALMCLLLPVLGRSLEGALVGLFLFYLSFEFTLVSTLPLMSQLVPGARATLMAGNIAAHSLGRALGALIGPVLFTAGLPVNGAVAAALSLGALAVLALLVKENHDDGNG